MGTDQLKSRIDATQATDTDASALTHRTLIVLLLVYAISYMDRQLVAILIEPIKRELAMSDTSAGLLYGFAFAAFYSILGIPIARLADRSNRSRIIVISLMLFSAMTAVCGMATSYLHLMLARIGVGIGEAGTNPPSQSIIADLYPPERRGFAMALYALGLNLGIVLGFLVGGSLAQFIGWRATFVIAGGFGLLMGVIAACTLKEPARLHRQDLSGTKQLSASQAVQALSRNVALRHLFAGATIANVAISGLLAWLPAFIIRSHELSLSMTGALLAVVIGVLGGLGTLLGGAMADRLGARNPAWRLRCVVVVFMVAAVCWSVAVTAQSRLIALPFFVVGGALIAFHVGPSLAMVQTLARPDTRAFAASLLIFLANLIGVGVGPLLVGWLSDAWFAQHGAQSLGAALLIAPPLFFWAAVHYEVAARALVADPMNTNEGPTDERSSFEASSAAAT
jgi:predicted MFS family arabinose efflux permease